MNYITILIYSLLLISFFIGSKKAKLGTFNNEALSLDAMTNLKGVMAIMVLMHHISQKAAFQQTHTIPVFENIGFLFVGVFFFCSGYGLYKSYLTKENYLKGFLKKRVLPIVISYYVMIALYAIYHLVIGSEFTLTQWICKLTGLVIINSQSWYVYVIIILYISFYFIFKNERLRKHGILLLLIICLLQGVLFLVINHFPWYIGEKDWWKVPGAFNNLPWYMRHCALPFEGEWWVNSTIGFITGLFFAQNEKGITEYIEKNYLFCLVATIIAVGTTTYLGNYSLKNIGYWTEFSGNLGVDKKTFCYIIQGIQVIVFNFFIILLMKKFYVHNKFYTVFGKASLEVYLIQEMILFSFAFLIETGRTPIFKVNNYNILLYAVVVTVTVLASSLIYQKINQTLTKGLKK